MQRKLVTSADGSPTLFVPELDEHYHSIHGAIQESKHVFIKYGLQYQLAGNKQLNILEIGFGTGLNALLTLLENSDTPIDYVAIEAYPLSLDEVQAINYTSLLDRADKQDTFLQLHQCRWDTPQAIQPGFQLTKINQPIERLTLKSKFDLIYFDAFAPSAQPELWTHEVFDNMYGLLDEDGTLVTYCAKGSVKRTMKAVGFTVEPLPGPPGKREMTRAIKR